MSRPHGVRGWCPTAWRPMMAGDGLILRVRPRLAHLSPDRARAVVEVARAFGNGLIDLTNRAALQLRGLAREDWPMAIGRLAAAGLVDPDPVREARALLVAPEWRHGDDTHRIAGALLDRLDALPPMPGKIGVAIDAGVRPVLTDSPADFRIERAGTGALILRADGRPAGIPLRHGEEADALVALARWFVDSGGARAGRMARHAAPLPGWASGDLRPASAAGPMPQGRHPLGVAMGLPFGRIDADGLAAIVSSPGVAGLRLTPWRILLVEGTAPGALPVPAHADVSIDACVGAPACPQASVETRALARRLAPLVGGRLAPLVGGRLAPLVGGRLHVSGCAKGCARGTRADVVATGRDGRFDLAFDARAGDPPVRSGLSADDLAALLERHVRAA